MSTYVKKLLQKCLGGPCTTPNELETCIKHHTDLSEVVVKTELSYFVNTHKSERIMNRDLFKIMIPHSERLENLMVLLGDNDWIATSMQASVLDLPRNQDLSEALLKPVVTERRLINENVCSCLARRRWVSGIWVLYAKNWKITNTGLNIWIATHQPKMTSGDTHKMTTIKMY